MAGSYNGVAVPSSGKRIGYANGTYEVPDNPVVPFIEGDGTGRDIWKASLRVFDAAVEKAYKGKRRVAWYEVFAGEKAKAKFDTWLPADHARGWRHSFSECGAAADSRSLRLRAAGEVLQGRAVAGEASGAHGPGHLSGEHRRRLHRHRVGRGNCGMREADRVPQQGHAERRQETDSARFRCRHQTDFDHWNQATGAHGDSSCARNWPQERDPGAQGKYPEIYRGRVPKMGIRVGYRRISRQSGDRA